MVKIKYPNMANKLSKNEKTTKKPYKYAQKR
jgi:hypothetical protein